MSEYNDNMGGLRPWINTDEYTGERGLYVEARLHPEYGERLYPICDQLHLPAPDLQELHCTLVYSREAAPEEIPRIKGYLKGAITGVQYWKGHDGNNYVVADIHGLGFIDAHAKLLRAGAEHSFIGYKPHVTLAKLDELPANIDDLLPAVNKQLQANPLQMMFHQVNAKDIKPD